MRLPRILIRRFRGTRAAKAGDPPVLYIAVRWEVFPSRGLGGVGIGVI